MKSQETLATVESIQTDEDPQQNHAKKEKKFECKFCGKRFEKFQALGGHMNKHPEDRFHEKAKSAVTLINKIKMKSKQFKSMNLGGQELGFGKSAALGPVISMPQDFIMEILSFSNIDQSKDVSNSIQQPPMESYEAWPTPQQLNWQLDAQFTYDYFINMSNQYASYIASDEPIDGKNDMLHINSSLDKLTSEEYNVEPIYSSAPIDNNPLPCDSIDYDLPSPRHYEDQQVILENEYPQEQGNSFSTLNHNQSNITMPLNIQMNDTLFPEYAKDLPSSGMETETIVAPQDTKEISYNHDEFDFELARFNAFNRWNGLPTDRRL